MSSTPATTNAARYARIVEEYALLSRLIGVAGEIAELGYSVPDDVTKALHRAESPVYEVNERRVTESTHRLSDMLEEHLDQLDAHFEKRDSSTGPHTGHLALAQILSGHQPTTLAALGAPPPH